MNGTTIHRVYLETPRYTFEAFGTTQAEALLVFRRGWDAHVAQTGAAAFDSEKFARQVFPDLAYDALELGACYRDRRLLHG